MGTEGVYSELAIARVSHHDFYLAENPRQAGKWESFLVGKVLYILWLEVIGIVKLEVSAAGMRHLIWLVQKHIWSSLVGTELETGAKKNTEAGNHCPSLDRSGAIAAEFVGQSRIVIHGLAIFCSYSPSLEHEKESVCSQAFLFIIWRNWGPLSSTLAIDYSRSIQQF